MRRAVLPAHRRQRSAANLCVVKLAPAPSVKALYRGCNLPNSRALKALQVLLEALRDNRVRRARRAPPVVQDSNPCPVNLCRALVLRAAPPRRLWAVNLCVVKPAPVRSVKAPYLGCSRRRVVRRAPLAVPVACQVHKVCQARSAVPDNSPCRANPVSPCRADLLPKVAQRLQLWVNPCAAKQERPAVPARPPSLGCSRKAGPARKAPQVLQANRCRADLLLKAARQRQPWVVNPCAVRQEHQAEPVPAKPRFRGCNITKVEAPARRPNRYKGVYRPAQAELPSRS